MLYHKENIKKLSSNLVYLNKDSNVTYKL